MLVVGGTAVASAMFRNYHLFIWVDRAFLYAFPPALVLYVGRPKGLGEVFLALMAMLYMLVGGVTRYLDGLISMPMGMFHYGYWSYSRWWTMLILAVFYGLAALEAYRPRWLGRWLESGHRTAWSRAGLLVLWLMGFGAGFWEADIAPRYYRLSYVSPFVPWSPPPGTPSPPAPPPIPRPAPLPPAAR